MKVQIVLLVATVIAAVDTVHGRATEASCLKNKLSLRVFNDSIKVYYLSTQTKTWYEAKRFCESNGMHLASPKTQEEFKLLQDMAGNATILYMWLSASTVGYSPDDFRWHDGTKLPLDSQLWCREVGPQPNEKGRNACVYMTYKHYCGPKLFDSPCGSVLKNFMCEVPVECNQYLNIIR